MPAAKKPVLPTLPATFKAPMVKVTTKPNGFADLPGYFPFYYAGIQSLWLWWLVELKRLDKMLEPYGCKALRFANGGDMGLVNINFFSAACLYGNGQIGNPGVGGFNETELNIVAFPKAVHAAVPDGELTVENYLMQGDQTKRSGNFRLWVACDNAIAVAAGRQRYMERKFLAAYDYKVPNPNNDPKQQAYQWTACDAAEVRSKPHPFIYQGTADLTGLTPQPGNPSEWIDLSFDKKTKRPVASRRNYLGVHDTFLVQHAPANPVQMAYGTSQHPMRADMEKLIGSRPAFALHRFISPPCIIEAAPYYADL